MFTSRSSAIIATILLHHVIAYGAVKPPALWPDGEDPKVHGITYTQDLGGKPTPVEYVFWPASMATGEAGLVFQVSPSAKTGKNTLIIGTYKRKESKASSQYTINWSSESIEVGIVSRDPGGRVRYTVKEHTDASQAGTSVAARNDFNRGELYDLMKESLARQKQGYVAIQKVEKQSLIQHAADLSAAQANGDASGQLVTAIRIERAKLLIHHIDKVLFGIKKVEKSL